MTLTLIRDLDARPWIEYSEDVPVYQKLNLQVKTLKIYRSNSTERRYWTYAGVDIVHYIS